MYSISIATLNQLLITHDLLREIYQDGQLSYRIGTKEAAVCCNQLSYDSQDVSDGTLFFCKGERFKYAYIEQAVAKGVRYYVSEVTYEIQGAIGFIVNDIRETMAIVAREFYKRPDDSLTIVGLTGTKGKTTTTFLTKSIVDQASPNTVGVISTLAVNVDGKINKPAQLTTPEALDLWKMLATAVENDLSVMLIEVSSQAYKMKRVFGMTFDIGVFLNFSSDHIGTYEHPTLEDYLYCKTELMKHSDSVVVNRQLADFEFVAQVAAHYADQVISYGLHNADYELSTRVKYSKMFSVQSQKDTLCITGDYLLNIPGDFNKENALCAIIIARLLNIELQYIEDGLAQASIPGRMEHVSFGSDNHVYVDFAHNYISLKRLLDFIDLTYPNHSLMIVLGAPGGKGESRRQDMGQVLSEYEGTVILTEDDANYDKPRMISEEIASHITGDKMHITYIDDRVEAIEYVIDQANHKSQCVVIIAGKGSDQYMIKQGKKIPYIGDNILVNHLLEV